MATCILKWNPAISSYRMLDYLRDLDWCQSGGYPNMNWSVWDHQLVKKGDTVYMLKVGAGPKGIVAKGKVTGSAYRGEDWSGKGRETYYVDFDFTCMVAPDCAPILEAATLQRLIPDFDWMGGHSGLMLNEEQERLLNEEWDAYLHANFGEKPVSKRSVIYVKSRKKPLRREAEENEATKLGVLLYKYINKFLEPQYIPDFDSIMKTMAWLLQDANDLPAAAYANLECAKQLPWNSLEFPHYLKKAIEIIEVIRENGIDTNIDLASLKENLEQREAYGRFMQEAKDKAEHGELSANLRELIDGYDLINGKMGSFHDSKLFTVNIDHTEDYIELQLYMCNGANHDLVLRFEGKIEYEIYGDADCDYNYLYGGYFYRANNRACLYLDGLGHLFANRVRVVSFTPAE